MRLRLIDMGRLSFFHKTLVIAVLGLGIYFRFEHLDKKLLWHDEVGTKLFAAGLHIEDWQSHLYNGRVIDVEAVRSIYRLERRGPLDILRGLVQDDPQHPPLYYLIAGIWMRRFGDDIVTLRLLSALLSLFIFPAMYWLCQELFRSAWITWTGVALVATSPFFVLYAQEAREYALWFALVLFSNAALLRALRLTHPTGPLDPRLLTAWALYTIFTVLGLYTSLATAHLMIAQAMFVGFRERLRINRITLMSAGAFAIVAILFLPWAIALMIRWEAFAISMAWSKVITIPTRSLLEIFALNLSRPSIDFWPDRHGGIVTIAGIGLAMVLVILAIVFMIRRARLRTAALVLALIFVPVLMLLGPDLLFGGIRSVSARYLTITLMGVELALAFLFGSSIKGNRGWFCIWLIALFVRIGSCFHNAKQEVVWTKGISYNLPQVARFINQAPAPLVVGNRERHHPGNLLALSFLLKPGTKMQFLTPEMVEKDYRLLRPFTVFLFSPIDQFRQNLDKRANVRAQLLVQDLHLELWIVEASP